jgi:hypothetical protein
LYQGPQERNPAALRTAVRAIIFEHSLVRTHVEILYLAALNNATTRYPIIALPTTLPATLNVRNVSNTRTAKVTRDLRSFGFERTWIVGARSDKGAWLEVVNGVRGYEGGDGFLVREGGNARLRNA